MYKILNITENQFLQDFKTFEHIILNKDQAKKAKLIYTKLTGQKFKLFKVV